MHMSTKPRSSYITVRVTTDVRSRFHDKAESMGTNPSEVLRELIDAFIDDRLVIQPNPKKESLYVTRIEN